MQNRNIFIIAGEESGDTYGAEIAKYLYSEYPSIKIYGIGGKKMSEEGVNLIENIDNISVVGIVEVLKHIPYIFQVLKKVKAFLIKNKIDTVILIDFPDFNFKIAKFAKTNGIKVYYYISPQIWAWRRGRINFIKKYVNKMFVIFPFEVIFYKEYGVNAEFVGHPLAYKIKNFIEENQDVYEDDNIIGILPGSRKGEIERHLPIIVKACEIIKKRFPKIEFLLPVAKNIDINIIKRFTESYPYIKILQGKNYYLMKRSKLIISASGTATLECALFGKPVIIIYKVNFLSYILGKLLIKVPFIGMPNLLAGKMINPELIQYSCNHLNIYFEAVKILKNKEKYLKIRECNFQLIKMLYKENCFNFVKEILIQNTG